MPGAIDPVTQQPYTPPDGFVCLLCLAARAPKVLYSKDKANMRATHLPTRHPREWEAAQAAHAGAAAPRVQPGGAFYLALSGGTFRPPSRPGILRIERMLQAQCKGNIIAAMRADGVLNDRGQLPKPLLSASADGSTEQSVTGKTTISLRVYWLDADFNKRSAVLAVGAFGFDWNLKTPDEKVNAIVRATAVNLAKWVVMVLKDFQILPPDFPLTGRAVADFLFGFSCDSASAEICMVRTILGILCHNDPNHILALIMKGALYAKKDHPKLLFDTLGDRMSALARNHKKGNNGAALYGLQQQDKAVRPLKLVSMNKTRWNGVARVYERMILLRPWMDAATRNADHKRFDEMDFKIINQTNSFLALANETSKALQDRSLIIGEHVVPLLRMLTKLRKPETLPMLAEDFYITVEQLNARQEPDALGERLRLLSVQGLLGTCATTFAARANLDPEVNALRERMVLGFKERAGLVKDQLSNTATLLAIALDPLMKGLLEPPNTAFFPQESAAAGPKPPGPAGDRWGYGVHARAWAELGRLQRSVHAWEVAQARISGSGSGASSGAAGANSKRSRDGDHPAADLADALGVLFGRGGAGQPFVVELKDEIAVRGQPRARRLLRRRLLPRPAPRRGNDSRSTASSSASECLRFTGCGSVRQKPGMNAFPKSAPPPHHDP